MLVREIMTIKIHCATPETTVDEALRLLGVNKVTSLPVVTTDGAVVGVLSEADLLPALVPHDTRAHQRPLGPQSESARLVVDLMTRHPGVVPPGEDVAELAKVMVRHGWKSVPVVEQGRIVGMVSRSDVVQALARSESDVRTDLRKVLDELGHPDWDVSLSAGQACVVGPATEVEQQVATAAALGIRGVRGATSRPSPGLTRRS
jgi:CBS domain-containing protein